MASLFAVPILRVAVRASPLPVALMVLPIGAGSFTPDNSKTMFIPSVAAVVKVIVCDPVDVGTAQNASTLGASEVDPAEPAEVQVRVGELETVVVSPPLVEICATSIVSVVLVTVNVLCGFAEVK